jgi:hypothetical protein
VTLRRRCFIEEDMYFKFDAEWTHVVAWDKESAYTKGLKDVHGGKAVDFVGLYRKKTIYFIEVKDFRAHRTDDRAKKKEEKEKQNKKNKEKKDLWVTFELKVRNTVAALVGAHHSGRYEEACGPIVPALTSRQKVMLVFWLDARENSLIPQTIKEQRRQARAGFTMQNFKRHLKWLDASVMTASSAVDYNKVVPGLEAVSLPNEPRARAELLIQQLEQRDIDVSGVQSKLHDWVSGDWGSRACRKKIDELLCRAPEVSSVQELFVQRR